MSKMGPCEPCGATAENRCICRALEDMEKKPSRNVCKKDFRLNKRNRERLAILKRRHDHLAARVNSNQSLTHDAAECSALFWAIRVLEKTLSDEG